MVDFFYDNFYEVLSGEGLWVLILIGCALAVASFILLTMKIEVNPKQNQMNNVIKTAQKEETVQQKKDKKKKKKIKLGGMFKGAEKDTEGAEVLMKSTVVMPVRPEIAQPDQEDEMEQAEQMGQVEPVNVEMTDPDGFDIPALPEMEDEPSPLNDTDTSMASMEAEDTLETYDGENADTMTEDNAEIEEASTDTEKSEEDTGEEGEKEKDSSSIFDIFSEVDEEESNIGELAKNMEDVTINGLLSDTETLSEELKNIFSKHRRA